MAKNGGIVNQVYKVTPQIPLEMYKDLASFKLYMNDVGLFVNKAGYPLYQIDLSEQPTMISMGPLTEHFVAGELKKKDMNYIIGSLMEEQRSIFNSKNADIIPIEIKLIYTLNQEV